MTTEKLNLFTDQMMITLKKAGSLATSLQGKVVNKGKLIEHLPNDSALVQAQRSAKTEVDDTVQEILLSAAAKVLDSSKVLLDAEENTPTVKLFSTASASLSLVIDPLDGTYEYLSGKDSYAVCVGLIEAGRVISALIYFPKRDSLYFLSSIQQPCLIKNFSSSKNGKIIHLQSGRDHQNSNLVYVNNRVTAEYINHLRQNGYKVITEDQPDVNWLDALINCILGKYSAFIAHTPQIRDVLLGALIEKMAGGYAITWTGKKLVWPSSGRIRNVIFGVSSDQEKILRCLNKS